ncbi:MAG: heme o synthase [Chloroflexota bacterium]|nr:heme o synthase [Chloroflexota bacterium]
MALVVSAGSPLEAQPGAGQSSFVPRPRLSRRQLGLGWLALGGSAWYGLSLVVDNLARDTAPTRMLDLAARIASGGGMLVVLAACIGAWLFRRDSTGLLVAATLAPILVAARAVASGVLVTLELPTLADVAGVALGLLVLGCLVWVGSVSIAAHMAAARTASAEADLFRRVVDVTAFVVFFAGLTGISVRAVGASWACQGQFPDCNGLGALPLGRDPLADIQLYHRLLAYATLALVVWVVVEARRRHRAVPALGRAGLILLGCTVAQGAIGGVSVSTGNPALMQALHMAGAAATWSAAIVLAVFARRGALTPALSQRELLSGPAPLPRGEAARSAGEGLSLARQLSAYVQLTKPRVMSLLLATTATAMVIAARGMPPLGVFVWTLVGGALMSGGAGAINHYVDRDIDPLMGRTAWRPIPSGVISPGRALWFGIGLGVLAGFVFVVFVNLIACVLSIAGLLGYVFIYTLWLKRSTPSNIVIGGAAGAIPPLVGWAAVTNEISSLTAWYLFAIIFFWTPPHFWALSLLIRKHYERAGVPMLPVVRGEDETRRQIALYSVLLVVLTLVLSPFGMMGGIYFVAAAVLGALFIRGALRLLRQATPQAARSLYLYSMVYLFALFAAMAVDRAVVL